MTYMKLIEFENYIKNSSRTNGEGFIQDYSVLELFNIPDPVDTTRLNHNTLFITGIPGSGKSELAADLASVIKLPIISLDDLDEGNFSALPKDMCIKYLEWDQFKADDFRSNSESFLQFVIETDHDPIVVEGRQVYENPKVMKIEDISCIAIVPNLEAVITNRTRRDGIFGDEARNLIEQELKLLMKFINK